MDLTFKKVGIEYLKELVDLRIEFITDIHPDYDKDLIKRIHRATHNYLKEHFKKKSYHAYLGLINNEVVCTAGLLIYYLPPLNSDFNRKIGHVLNFYTRPNQRKKGFGIKLMEYIKVSAKQEGIIRLVLNATKMGYPLYKKSGFIEPKEVGMSLDL